MYCLASMRFQVSTAASMKYEDVRQAELGGMQENGTTRPDPFEVIIRLSALLDGRIQ